MAQKEDNSAFYATLAFIAFMCLLIGLAAYSGSAKADTAKFKVDLSNDITLTEVCLNGRLFLTTTSGTGRFNVRGVSTIQVMRHLTQHPNIVVPVLCTAIQGSSTNFITQGQE